MFAGLYCAPDPMGIFHGDLDENGHKNLSRVEVDVVVVVAGDIEQLPVRNRQRIKAAAENLFLRCPPAPLPPCRLKKVSFTQHCIAISRMYRRRGASVPIS